MAKALKMKLVRCLSSQTDNGTSCFCLVPLHVYPLSILAGGDCLALPFEVFAECRDWELLESRTQGTAQLGDEEQSKTTIPRKKLKNFLFCFVS